MDEIKKLKNTLIVIEFIYENFRNFLNTDSIDFYNKNIKNYKEKKLKEFKLKFDDKKIDIFF